MENLARLLQLIDYSKGYKFLGIRPQLCPILKSSLEQVNIPIVSENEAILYRLPKEDAIQLDVRYGLFEFFLKFYNDCCRQKLNDYFLFQYYWIFFNDDTEILNSKDHRMELKFDQSQKKPIL